MLRAVDGIDCEAKLESELPIPVVREPSISFRGDGDLCRIVVWTVGATYTIPGTRFIDPGALVTFGAVPGATLIDPGRDTGMQPAATVKDAPLAMSRGEGARWLCNRATLCARAGNMGADIATACGGRAVIGAAACVETDEPMEVHDREITMRPGVGVRMPFGTGVCVPLGRGVR